MINKVFIICLFFCSFSFFANGQQNDSIQINNGTIISDSISTHLQDTIPLLGAEAVEGARQGLNDADTVAWIDGEIVTIPQEKVKFKPNSSKAVLYTAIFPGLGQVYNRKYWKLPIVYGGLVGLVYAITWNGRIYGDYTDGYRAIMKEDYFSDGNYQAWESLLSRSQINNDVDGDTHQFTDASRLTFYRERIRRSRDYFRRNRDLAIIGVIGLYAISMIDAYVDAELFDFDISTDLSFKVAPYVGLDAFQNKMIGIQCNIIF